ncbi:MAG: UDP-N-acetylglucosamine 2-epimerase (non-hydrolyzing) [Candidatus Bathyarchaeia archaeon]
MKILTVFGTRPEAIKLAPVIRELQRRMTISDLQTVICVTAQHRQMLDQVLCLFDIVPDYDLNVMEDNQSPTQVAAAVLARLEPILQAEKPDWVLVQGDTTTVAAASLAAFYARVRVGHVEAGLRTYDKWHPFPEEINRRVAGVIADLHFAPTERARQNLLREGIPDERIVVTGNPVIDALHWIAAQPFDVSTLNIEPLERSTFECNTVKLILVTAHRRENFGRPLENICLALRDIALRYNGRVRIIYPVHLNPNVWNPVHRLLGDVPNIILTPPLDYLPMVHLMKRSYLVLTDSGGIQEEAPGLGVPVLVLREVTERPEAVEAGTVRVVGTDRERIVAETVRLLEDTDAYEQMARAVNPYGDGHAAERIVEALMRWHIGALAR